MYGEYSEKNSILHKAANNGDKKIVELILNYAQKKKIEINAKNSKKQSAIAIAKDDPEVVKLLMKNCNLDNSDLRRLGLKTLASMTTSFVCYEPPKKKMKNAKK